MESSGPHRAASERQVRTAVAGFIGGTTALVGVLIVLSADPASIWERLHGATYLVIAAGCLLGWGLNRLRFAHAFEFVLLITAYLGIAGVILTGPVSTAFLTGLSGSTVVVLLPGRTFEQNGRALLVLTCSVYMLGVVGRTLLRADDPPSPPGEMFLKVMPPLTAISLVWLIIRSAIRR